MSDILISEIFGPTIQGEGALVGRQTVFVRTGGCDFLCDWCDTLYAVLPKYKGDWHKMNAEQILAKVEELSGGHPILITLSGGNPALQPLSELLERGRARGHAFAMETQGSKAPAWLSRLNYLVLSPKPPSSRMDFAPEKLAACFEAARSQSDGKGPEISLKVVVFDDADFAFARRVHKLHPDIPFFLSVGNPNPGQNATASGADLTRGVEWLLEKCREIGWTSPTILPQVHVLLWGNERGK